MKLDEWGQALVDAMAKRAESVPKGWIVMDEFARRIGKSISTARPAMKTLMTTGAAQSKTFRIEAGSRIMPVPHYRLKK